jgi:hypothetical protein
MAERRGTAPVKPGLVRGINMIASDPHFVIDDKRRVGRPTTSKHVVAMLNTLIPATAAGGQLGIYATARPVDGGAPPLVEASTAWSGPDARRSTVNTAAPVGSINVYRKSAGAPLANSRSPAPVTVGKVISRCSSTGRAV